MSYGTPSMYILHNAVPSLSKNFKSKSKHQYLSDQSLRNSLSLQWSISWVIPISKALFGCILFKASRVWRRQTWQCNVTQLAFPTRKKEEGKCTHKQIYVCLYIYICACVSKRSYIRETWGKQKWVLCVPFCKYEQTDKQHGQNK